MDLLYKADWEGAKERYRAWWAHEVVDRCAIAVTAPKDDLPPEEPPRAPERIEDRWLDLDYLAALNGYHHRRTFYGGEAFPIWHPGYPGWACIPAFLGCPVILKETTGWLDPIISEGDLTEHDYRKLTIASDNRWWLLAQEMLRFAVQESRGKSIPSIGAFGGCGDNLAALRGTEQLLLDMVHCPHYVCEFEIHLMRLWIQVHDVFHRIIRTADAGTTCWFPLWSPGTFYAAQNDFSYMISPRMFRDVFLRAIEMQTESLDHTIYHVDGVGAYAHVDALCELPSLRALQILPGEGKASPLHYTDVLKRVQAAGKNLHITIPSNEVEPALRELSIRGLFIETWCDSEKEAQALLRNVAIWSRDR
jgi:hypothetical protein